MLILSCVIYSVFSIPGRCDEPFTFPESEHEDADLHISLKALIYRPLNSDSI